MKNKPDVILKMEEKSVVEEIAEFLRTLNEEQQKQMEFMIRGLKMGIGLKENDGPKPA